MASPSALRVPVALPRATGAQPSALPRGCFIVGTDTGVGKTVVTAALARWMHGQGVGVGVMKPIETGVTDQTAGASDAERLRRAAGSTDLLEEVSPYRFPAPVAPLAAARAREIRIDLERIALAFRALAARHAFMLVEGIGGVRVPLTGTSEVRDLVNALALPALVVGRPAIGGVNHALLTIEALQQRHVSVLAVVLNHSLPPEPSTNETTQQSSTLEMLRELAGVRVVGPLAYESRLGGAWDDGVELLAKNPTIGALGELLLAKA